MLERLPVIVGVAQRTHRDGELDPAREPLRMMEEVARAAIVDADAPGLAARIDSVRVVNVLSASYRDPAGALGGRLGLAAGERLYTSIGGNAPQWLVNRTADDLVAGRSEVALLAGAEAMQTLRLATRQGVALGWTRERGHPPMIGDTRFGSHPDEWKHGAQMPGQIYPLFEIALRAATGERPDAHRRRIAALSASFARVAADNPLAWFRDGKTATEIGAIAAGNRMVAFPYTKFMNAILEVDQAAAVVMTTAATARALGVPAARCVHLHGGGDAHDIWFLKDRVDYHSSPGMAAAYEAALAQAAITPDALGPVDLYSCFPVAPQFGARLLGLPCDGSRPLTVTGGLPYFGGAGSNYAMHAIATMVGLLRRAPDTLGLVSGLGWYMTRHAVGIYGAAPPLQPWHRAAREQAERQARIDALPHPPFVAAAEGPARIETYTVLHDREGAAADAIVIARLESGARTFANVGPDRDALAVLEAREMVGAPGRVTEAGGRNWFRLLGA